MQCQYCGSEPPDGSRYCNMCGKLMFPKEFAEPVQVQIEHRWIFIDLHDLDKTEFNDPNDEIATIASYIYERFTPFADDGWEWHISPSDAQFTGWVYSRLAGERKIVGANLFCKRVANSSFTRVVDPCHHISEYRLRQLVQRSQSIHLSMPK